MFKKMEIVKHYNGKELTFKRVIRPVFTKCAIANTFSDGFYFAIGKTGLDTCFVVDMKKYINERLEVFGKDYDDYNFIVQYAIHMILVDYYAITHLKGNLCFFVAVNKDEQRNENDPLF